MGTLVKVAQRVEDRVNVIRQQSEPKLKLKFQEARAEWLELKARGKNSAWDRVDLRSRAGLVRADATVRMSLGHMIGRVIVELEKIRRRLLGAA